jgi:hypothetical protein
MDKKFKGHYLELRLINFMTLLKKIKSIYLKEVKLNQATQITSNEKKSIQGLKMNYALHSMNRL